jgi:hypothetical protein
MKTILLVTTAVLTLARPVHAEQPEPGPAGSCVGKNYWYYDDKQQYHRLCCPNGYSLYYNDWGPRCYTDFQIRSFNAQLDEDTRAMQTWKDQSMLMATKAL